MKSKCTCFNSGTNCFTGACDRCGMSKNSAQKEKTEELLKQLIKETPNDFELGNRIRNIFS